MTDELFQRVGQDRAGHDQLQAVARFVGSAVGSAPPQRLAGPPFGGGLPGGAVSYRRKPTRIWGASMNKPIPPLDLMWLIMETQASPTHVGALLLFEKPKGHPAVVRRDRRGLPVLRADAAVQLRAGGRRRRPPALPRGDVVRSALPHPAHRAAGRSHVRRPASARGRPPRADARPRPAAVPRLDHRRRTRQPVRRLREGAPRHRRRRIRHEAAVREPEPEPAAGHPDARVRGRTARAQAPSAARPSSTVWRNSASRQRSRRSRCGTSRWARSRRGSRHCSAPTRSAARRSRRSADR